MNVIDIVILIPFAWAVYLGMKEGIVVQLGGIAGVIIGIWLALKYGSALGHAIRVNDQFAAIVGFIIILIVTLVLIALVGRLLKEIFTFAGLKMFDSVGGVLLSLLKMGLIMSVILLLFDALNHHKPMISQSKLDASLLYDPVKGIAGYIFPYIDFLAGKLH